MPEKQPQPQMVIGRVTTLKDGTKAIVAVSHKDEVIAHQGAIRELIEAARTYKESPTAEHLVALEKAARGV